MNNRYYYTFGYDRNFPYPDGYLVVVANDKNDSVEKFRRKYPDRHKGIINCSDIYNEEQWSKISKYYGKPSEVIH